MEPSLSAKSLLRVGLAAIIALPGGGGVALAQGSGKAVVQPGRPLQAPLGAALPKTIPVLGALNPAFSELGRLPSAAAQPPAQALTAAGVAAGAAAASAAAAPAAAPDFAASTEDSAGIPLSMLSAGKVAAGLSAPEKAPALLGGLFDFSRLWSGGAEARAVAGRPSLWRGLGLAPSFGISARPKTGPASPAAPGPAQRSLREKVVAAARWLKAALGGGRPEFPDQGLLKLSRNAHGKLRLTLSEEDFGKVFMLNATVEKGLAENWLYSMAPQNDAAVPVSFRRAGDRVEIVRKNMDYRARAGSEEESVVREAFADSVLASVPILSRTFLPGSKKGAVVVDFESVLLSDLTDMQNILAANYPEHPHFTPLPYRLVKEQSHVAAAKVFPRNAEFSMELRFANEAPYYRMAVPDSRSLALRMRYSFSALPEDGFKAREADERVGYFTTVYRDLTAPASAPALDVPMGRLAQRWRLEKADPKAAVSPVKAPIVWWLDRKIPQEYRGAVREGMLKWNAAFERLGYRDAIVVRDEPQPGAAPRDEAEAQFDPADIRYNVVHWYTGADADFAFASWRADPRTGEIYNAHLSFSLQILGGLGYRGVHEILAKGRPGAHKHGPSCRFAHEVGASMAALKDAGLSAEERARFSRELVVSYMVHEMGHALGLRHNFAASDFRTLDEIAQAKDGLISQSVMDYAASSFPAPENPAGAEVQTELGPYDFLAIDWGYRPVDGLSEAAAAADLSRVAGRIGEPGFEYATDDQIDGTDPYVAYYDFGPEPLDYAVRAVVRLRRSLDELAARPLRQGEDYSALRRRFDFIFNGQRMRALSLALPYIGGVRVRRVRAGQNAGKLPFEAVPVAKQRAALALMILELFSDQGVAVPEGLLAKLGPDLREPLGGPYAPPVDASLVPYEESVTAARKSFLDSLLSPERLKRMAESRRLGGEVMAPRELFDSLTASFAGELFHRRVTLPRLEEAMSSSVLRRRLQLAYLDALLNLVNGPLPSAEDDSRRGRRPENPYSAEAVAAAAAQLDALSRGLDKVIARAKAEAKKPRGQAPDPAVLSHLEHLLWRISNEYGS